MRTCPDCDKPLEVMDRKSSRDARARHFMVTYTGKCPEHGNFRWHESFEQTPAQRQGITGV